MTREKITSSGGKKSMYGSYCGLIRSSFFQNPQFACVAIEFVGADHECQDCQHILRSFFWLFFFCFFKLKTKQKRTKKFE